MFERHTMDLSSLVQQGLSQQPGQPLMTPGAPGYNPATAPMNPALMPSPSNAMPPQAPGQGAPTMPKGQDEVIVSALIKQLERLDAQKKMAAGVPPQM